MRRRLKGFVPWIAVGVGAALVYSGWQREPGREELLVLGFILLIAAAAVLVARNMR